MTLGRNGECDRMDVTDRRRGDEQRTDIDRVPWVRLPTLL